MEVAIVLPMALLPMYAIFDFGRAVAVKQLLDNATRAAARQAIVGTATLSTSNIQTTVSHYMAGLALNGMSVQVYQADPTSGNGVGAWNDAAVGKCIAVEVSGQYAPIIPNLSLLPAMTMRSKVLMYSEAN